MGSRGTEWAARGIRATLAVDRVAGLLGAAPSALVLAFASDAVLTRYSTIAYGATETYHPGSPEFDDTLFPFEEEAISRFFPPAPARVLIGAAGGGREAIVLAQRGHEVVAFEPSAPLIAGLAAHIPPGLRITAYRAAYEDLPTLHPAESGGLSADLATEPRFNAAILGWGSFSHLLSERHQIGALRAVSSVTDGPILVSFRVDPRIDGVIRSRMVRLQRRLPGRNKLSGAHFTMGIGYFQTFSRERFTTLFDQADLRVEALDTADASGFWGHAVLSRR